MKKLLKNQKKHFGGVSVLVVFLLCLSFLPLSPILAVDCTSDISLCVTQQDCEVDSNYYWYNDICNLSPQILNTYTIDDIYPKLESIDNNLSLIRGGVSYMVNLIYVIGVFCCIGYFSWWFFS